MPIRTVDGRNIASASEYPTLMCKRLTHPPSPPDLNVAGGVGKPRARDIGLTHPPGVGKKYRKLSTTSGDRAMPPRHNIEIGGEGGNAGRPRGAFNPMMIYLRYFFLPPSPSSMFLVIACPFATLSSWTWLGQEMGMRQYTGKASPRMCFTKAAAPSAFPLANLFVDGTRLRPVVVHVCSCRVPVDIPLRRREVWTHIRSRV